MSRELGEDRRVVPIAASVGERYRDGSYAAHHPDWHSPHGRWKAEQVFRMLERRGLEPAVIAEEGCGSGSTLSHLRAKLPRSTRLRGYDPSPHAIEVAKPVSADDVEIHLGSIVDDARRDVDLLMVLDVVEHVEDAAGFLRRMRERATWKLFHVPLEFTVSAALRPAAVVDVRRRVGHLHSYSREVFFELLAETGYRVEDYFYTESTTGPRPLTSRQHLVLPLRWLAFKISPSWAARTIGGFSVLVLAE